MKWMGSCRTTEGEEGGGRAVLFSYILFVISHTKCHSTGMLQ